MSAGRINEIVGELGHGDEIAVSERLKAEAVSFAARLRDLPGDDGDLTDARVAELLAATDLVAESFLTVAFPIIEYSDGVALENLPRALRHVASATAVLRSNQTAREIAAVPAIGRLVWAMAAFALHCERLDALVTLARLRIADPYDGDDLQVITMTALRYPPALRRNAGTAFGNYFEWLAGLDLLKSYPLFADDLEGVFLEGDLLLAMCTGRSRAGIYARGQEEQTVRRFRLRIVDARQRRSLEELFEGEGTIEERLEAAYGAVDGDRQGFGAGPARLIPV